MMTTTIPSSSSSEFADTIARQIAEHHEHHDDPKQKRALVNRLSDELGRLDVRTLHALFAALNSKDRPSAG